MFQYRADSEPLLEEEEVKLNNRYLKTQFAR